MADIQETLRVFLETDGTLPGILTGGIYDALELDQGGLTVRKKPALFDATTGQLKPAALIRWRGLAGSEIRGLTYRQFVHIYFYEQSGHSNIRAAMQRCFLILDRKQFTGTDESGGPYMFHFVDELGESIAEEFDGAVSNRQTYTVDFTRKA